MSGMKALTKYAAHPKNPLSTMYVLLDARVDPILNANKAKNIFKISIKGQIIIKIYLSF